jgi:hypothetical protein
MNKKYIILTTLLLSGLLMGSPQAHKWQVDLEGGWVWNGSNDVAIPGDTGTRFSLTDDLKVDSRFYYRLRLTYNLGARHQLSALYAPLKLDASGTLAQDLTFLDTTFPQGTSVTGIYRFNSYRLTYRYLLVNKPRLKLHIGFTAKIRDAEIAVTSSAASESKTNVGFVPLLNLLLDWQFHPRLGLRLEADALAAKQGRAEDVLLALMFKISKGVSLKLGYRFVEGGAENDEVYNFAFIHYAAAGILISF